MGVRHGLARVLSKRGLCSRSEAERLVREGRVRLDGRVVGWISCAWLPAVRSERGMVAQHLADLQAAAQGIERKLRQAGFEPAPPAG